MTGLDNMDRIVRSTGAASTESSELGTSDTKRGKFKIRVRQREPFFSIHHLLSATRLTLHLQLCRETTSQPDRNVKQSRARRAFGARFGPPKDWQAGTTVEKCSALEASLAPARFTTHRWISFRFSNPCVPLAAYTTLFYVLFSLIVV